MRYFIELSYHGKAYHGWQIQPNAISVQEVVESALSVILKQPMSIVGAGRTDSGVHAKQLYAHFDCEISVNELEITYKLNSLLPKDVAVKRVFRVKADAHARFNATARSYVYRLSCTKNVFNTHLAYYYKPHLELNKMNEAAKLLIGFKDFQCFSKSNTDVFTYNCNITRAEWKVIDNELHFFISADRFLRNMVRAIVGTLINVGIGKLEVSDIPKILASKDRGKAGYSVPAHGLYLTKVIYPEEITNYE